MKFSLTIVTLAIAALASASPAMEARSLEARSKKIDCPSGYEPMCCDATGIDGLLSTDCQNISAKVKTLKKFKKHCKAEGSTAACCTTTALGIAVDCELAS